MIESPCFIFSFSCIKSEIEKQQSISVSRNHCGKTMQTFSIVSHKVVDVSWSRRMFETRSLSFMCREPNPPAADAHVLLLCVSLLEEQAIGYE